jgi:NAD(P)-dependent dehydrogenase (short-subunit alcohol dehydrogenase family)
MAVNFHGPLNVMRAAVPILRAGGGGHIVNISAAAAIANYAGFSIYGAAKAALEAASESLRLEVAAQGIHVTLVQPGPFRTEFIGRSLRKVEPVQREYEATVGKFSALLGRMHGRQPGSHRRNSPARPRAAPIGAREICGEKSPRHGGGEASRVG